MIPGGDISFSLTPIAVSLCNLCLKSYSDLDNIFVDFYGFSLGNNDLVMIQNETKRIQ